jgi:hypothetical protein
LTRDPSLVTVYSVLTPAVRVRTQLIDRLVLAPGGRLTGRFASKTRWVPWLDRRTLLAWTAGQVGRYAALLDLVLADDGTDRQTRGSAARLRVALPGVAVTAVLPLLDDADVVIAEAALTGLAAGDEPTAALPELLARTDGDRARVTLYAAARCLREVPPPQAFELLAGVLTTAPKVSARKEAARLLTVLRLPGAVDALTACLNRAEEHRDVRAAALTALRGWLDDDRVWPVLTAATSGNRHIATALLGVDALDLPEPHRPRYAALVTALAGHPEEQVSVPALATLPQWARWDPGAAGALVTAALAEAPGVWQAAAHAAAEPALWRHLPAVPADITTALLARAGGTTAGWVEADAETRADRPARRRLDVLVGALRRHAAAARREPGAVRGVADLLVGEATLLPAAAGLYADLLTSAGTEAGVGRLANLLAAYPIGARNVGRGLVARTDLSMKARTAAAQALAGRTDTAAGLLLCGLVELGGQGAGWSAPWRQLLRELRRHPSVEVRVAALDVSTGAGGTLAVDRSGG